MMVVMVVGAAVVVALTVTEISLYDCCLGLESAFFCTVKKHAFLDWGTEEER